MRHIHNIIYRLQSAIQLVKVTPAFKLQHPELTMPRFITHVQPDCYPNAPYAPLGPVDATEQVMAFQTNHNIEAEATICDWNLGRQRAVLDATEFQYL